MKSTITIPIIGGLAILGYIATQQPTAAAPIIHPVPIDTPMVENTVAPAAALPVAPVIAAKPTPTPLVFPTIVTTGPAYIAPVTPVPTPMVDNPNDGWNRWH